MISSMTGFGRYDLSNEKRRVTVEIKSVNHRYNEMSVRLPKKINNYEVAVRNLLKQYACRGKIDVCITYEELSSDDENVKYNENIVKEYLSYIECISEKFGIKNDIDMATIVSLPDVFTVEENTDASDDLWNDIETAVVECAKRFADSRTDEGERLKEDIFKKLDNLLVMVKKIEERSPMIVSEYKARLMEKVNELLGDRKVDDAVLATEMIVFADKICVDEETVRLRSHINNMKETMETGTNIGRKLDFIAQEMNREANTTLSKANDIEISNIAIDLKTEIEKIREQIQNIE